MFHMATRSYDYHSKPGREGALVRAVQGPQYLVGGCC